MAFLVLVAAIFVLAPAVHVVGQLPGYLSIDCGLDGNYSGYKDTSTGIVYVSDSPYVGTGENHVLASNYESLLTDYRHRQTLRSFPSGQRNCYALPTDAGAKYLVRAQFEYGNYDGRNAAVEFELHLGPNYWDIVNVDTATSYHFDDAVFVAWASWAPVCLVNTGRGTAFLSTLELSRLGDALYPPLDAPGRAMALYDRRDVGAHGKFIRYPYDQYDRFWLPRDVDDPLLVNLSTARTIQPDPSFVEPSPVLQTAITSINYTTLYYWWLESRTLYSFMIFLHFADFQNAQLRQFDIYFNGNRMGPSEKPYSPPFLAASCVYNSEWYKAADGKYNFTLRATATSVLSPMINALEIYSLIAHDNPTTFSKDCELSLCPSHTHINIE